MWPNFSVVLVTHKTNRAKQVALGEQYKSYTISIKICYLLFGLDKFSLPDSDADLQAIFSYRKQNDALVILTNILFFII